MLPRARGVVQILIIEWGLLLHQEGATLQLLPAKEIRGIMWERYWSFLGERTRILDKQKRSSIRKWIFLVRCLSIFIERKPYSSTIPQQSSWNSLAFIPGKRRSTNTLSWSDFGKFYLSSTIIINVEEAREVSSSLKEGVKNLRLLTWKNCWNTIREPINQAQSSQAFEYLLDLKSHHSVLYGSPGQTSSAIALTKASLFFISSQPSKFPSSWLANPHCGLTPILCSACSLVCPAPFAITSAAARIRSFIFSLSSSSGNLEVMTPRITFLCGGRWSRSSKVPARAVSYSK